MDYTTVTQQVKMHPPATPIEAHSLYRAFQEIPDGRKKRGVRYSLALLLTLIVLAKLAGEDTISGVVEWVRLREQWLNEHLGLEQQHWPCNSTYTYALRKLDAQVCTRIISAALTRAHTSRRCGDEPSRLLKDPRQVSQQHVAFDGKAMRGTNGHEMAHQPAVHLCALYEVATGNVIAQRAVQEKENEISAIKEMLTPVFVKGRLISADAMHTQREFCATVTRYEGDYVLIAKDNQPTMRQDLQLFFEDPDAPREAWQTATSVEKGHGRLEKRTVTTSVEMRDWFAREWCGIEQVFRVERSRTMKGKTSCEVVYGITSLTPTQANATQLAALLRAHWRIENRSHWRRDVTLREDQSQLRTQHAPEMLAVLNSTVLALMDLLGVDNVPSQRRRFNAAPEQALRLLVRSL